MTDTRIAPIYDKLTHFNNLRPNTPSEMIDIIKKASENYKIQARPWKKCVIVEKNGNRKENFSLYETLDTKGYPAYKDDNGYIPTTDIDHTEPMPYRDVNTAIPFIPNFIEYQYRVL